MTVGELRDALDGLSEEAKVMIYEGRNGEDKPLTANRVFLLDEDLVLIGHDWGEENDRRRAEAN